MINFLYSIDLTIFYFINHSISNPIFDKFFIFITDVKNWYLVYTFLWFICFFKGGRIGKIAAVLSLILIAVSDQLSSFVLKNLVERIRPCNALPDVRAITGCTGSFSFPSSHAVNNFAAAVFFYKIFPNLKWILFIVASLIAFSRVYVGKHYPSDVVGGAIIGSAIGYLFAYIAQKINQFYVNKNLNIDKDN
jgi:undecaprenyl-diphosphatase